MLQQTLGVGDYDYNRRWPRSESGVLLDELVEGGDVPLGRIQRVIGKSYPSINTMSNPFTANHRNSQRNGQRSSDRLDAARNRDVA